MNKDKYNYNYNGSFNVNVLTATGDSTTISPRDVQYTNKTVCNVKPLTQTELANGWQLKVPRAKRRVVEYMDEGTQMSKLSSNVQKFKINLAQLPPYLYKRKRLYRDSGFMVKNGCQFYYIEPTPIDNSIQELVNICNKPYNSIYKDKVVSLLNCLSENDIIGWCVVKASTMYL